MKKIKGFLISLLIIFSVPIVACASTLLGTNNEYLWIGNNSYIGQEIGDPTIGMIKLSGSNYGVSLEDEDVGNQTRVLTGMAWMGIGSSDDGVENFSPEQADSPSIGWLRFDQGAPSNCASLDPNGCHPVTWKRKEGMPTDSLEGYFTGWAKFDIGKDALGNDYPETWLRFKAPADTSNYDCNESTPSMGSGYYVCTDENGSFHGYAWSSGLNETLFTDNSGFGWVGFSHAGSITLGNVTENPPSSSCYILNNVSNHTICADSGVSYKASVFASIPGLVNESDYDFLWDCDGSGNFSPGPLTNECNYSSTSSTDYLPNLKYKKKTDSVWIEDCTRATGWVKLLIGKRCYVEMRDVANNNDNKPNPFVTEGFNIYVEKEVESHVVSQCVEGGTIFWDQPQNGIITSYPTSNTMIATFKPAGDGVVKATIKNVNVNGAMADIPCDNGKIKVRDKVKWGL